MKTSKFSQIPKHIYGLFMLLFVLSCAAPKPIIRWEDVSKPLFYQKGIAYHSAYADSIYAMLGVADIYKGEAYLDVEITNQRSVPILVDFSDTKYEFMHRKKLYKQYARNPEKEIMRVEMNENVGEVAGQNAVVAGLSLIAIGSIVAATADIKANNAENATQYTSNRALSGVGYLTANIGSDIVANGINHSNRDPVRLPERAFWMNIPFRRSHILPGETMRGTVIIPLVKDANALLKLSIPIENQVLEFNFRQQTYRIGQVYSQYYE